MKHITVLQHEAINGLDLSSDAVVVDCTFGSGGHAQTILSILGKDGTYIGLDADPTAIASGEALISSYDAHTHLMCANFRNIDQALAQLNIEYVDAIIADLGWRIEQFNGESGVPRGFSFQQNEPLQMTYGDPKQYAFTAHDIVNEWDEEDIANVIYAYGQEHAARRIARAIVARRKESSILTSQQLAQLVEESVSRGSKKRRTHPATKTFQALRIAVNDEFDALQELLTKGLQALKPGGRMAIITFHSLEDRIVKHTFKTFTRDQTAILVHKKPIAPSLQAQKENPRARSAKLRIIEKL